MFEGGDDIRALATRVPSLYAESSNGRLAPRFYIRGLGNSDFDLAASQPVSIIVDDVVLENVILKSFPLFDLERVEVLRGPQGTLFGRNTPAGIVKFDTKKPSQDFDGDVGLDLWRARDRRPSRARSAAAQITVSGRVSRSSITSAATRSTTASRGSDTPPERCDGRFRGIRLPRPAPALGRPTTFSALFNVHGREMSNGTAAIFRANVLGPGSNGFNSNYDRDTVTFDEGRQQPAGSQRIRCLAQDRLRPSAATSR